MRSTNARRLISLVPLSLICYCAAAPAATPLDVPPNLPVEVVADIESRSATSAADRPDLRIADAVAGVACERLALQGACDVIEIEREMLTPDVRLVSYRIQIGSDPEDLIVIRRAIPTGSRSERPGLLLMKGVGLSWTAAYLVGTYVDGISPDISPVVTLVRDGVDVWGMDFRWDTLPSDLADFDFMADWGLAMTVDDTRFLARFARYMRLLETGDFRRLALAGWSAGVPLAYAVASVESAAPRAERDLAALIPVDDVVKVDPEDAAYRDFACTTFYDELFEDGVFALDNIDAIELGQLALDDPDGQSAANPALTNEEFLASLLATPFSEEVPFHNFGASFDDNGVPTLLYFDSAAIPPGAVRLSRYAPVAYFRDINAIACTNGETGAFDRLSAIRLPTLVVGAAGGTNEAGLYGAGLTSGQVEFLKVGVLPEGEEAMDWGHTDVWQAFDAPDLVFFPISDWIRALQQPPIVEIR